MKSILTAEEFLDYKKKTSSTYSKAGWRTIGDKKAYFRSAWEANYARYLQLLKSSNNIKDWEHEPKCFWFEKIKRGTRSYLPDFRITKNDGTHHWVEVKGYMDSKSSTKLKRFAKYYPEETITLIQKEWFSKNKELKKIIREWE